MTSTPARPHSPRALAVFDGARKHLCLPQSVPCGKGANATSPLGGEERLCDVLHLDTTDGASAALLNAHAIGYPLLVAEVLHKMRDTELHAPRYEGSATFSYQSARHQSVW